MKPKDPNIDVTQLRSKIEYDPDTGALTHKTAHNGVSVGQECGWREKNGYVRIRVGRHKVLAHRIAWLLMTGHWPTELIDHKDRNRSNNAWDNLRLATYSENAHNSGLSKNNTSGCSGVVWRKHLSRWQATIRINGDRVSLGHFAEYDDAVAARRRAELTHHGDFMAVQVSQEAA